MEVAKGVHHFESGMFNWYVIEEQGRLTLVDAGFPGHYKIYEKGLQTLGRTNKDLDAIVLTHGHADHIGFAEYLRKKTGVPVFVHKKDVKMASRPLQLPWLGLAANLWRPHTLVQVFGHAALNGIFSLPHLTKVIAVENGQTLDIPGRPRIIHTPGHTQGEITLVLENRGVVLTGDTLITQNLLSGEHNGPQLAHPVLVDNYKESIRSLDSLRELGDMTILTGHGKLWKGEVNEAISLALEKARI